MSLVALLRAPWAAYASALERRPLIVKSLTSGVTYALGDVLAQYAEHQAKPAAERAVAFRPDGTRAAIFLLYGTVLAGPLYHLWFSRLDRLPILMYQLRAHRHRGEIMRAYRSLQRHGIPVELSLDKLPLARPFHKTTERAMKVLADQLVFSSLYTVFFFMSIGCMTGTVEKWRADAKKHGLEEAHAILESKYAKKPKTPDKRDLLRLKSTVANSPDDTESVDRVLALLEEEERLASTHTWRRVVEDAAAHTRAAFWETYLLDCVIWPPLQFINFSVVPLRYQVLYVNACNIAWNAWLSWASNMKRHDEEA